MWTLCGVYGPDSIDVSKSSLCAKTFESWATFRYNRAQFMAIPIGTQIGSHEITALLGKGGMGEVYRARDMRLKREVAIKILPEQFSKEADRMSRFQREAEVLASLNHPNIAAVYSLEEAAGSRYLVMELVEGETLADESRAARFLSMKLSALLGISVTRLGRRTSAALCIGI